MVCTSLRIKKSAQNKIINLTIFGWTSSTIHNIVTMIYVFVFIYAGYTRYYYLINYKSSLKTVLIIR